MQDLSYVRSQFPSLSQVHEGRRGIFVWRGNHYALCLTERLGVEEKGGMVRVGLAHYNTAREVERLVRDLQDLARSGS